MGQHSLKTPDKRFEPLTVEIQRDPKPVHTFKRNRRLVNAHNILNGFTGRKFAHV